MLTLWDLLTGSGKDSRRREARREQARAVTLAQSVLPDALVPMPDPEPIVSQARLPMRDRYERAAREMLSEHSVRVRKWRSNMSGVAWQVTYADGTVSRLIEAPRPRGPVSASVFLHEIGHHAIGFHRYSPRCLEEHMAWMFSLEMMTRYELNITEGVRRRVRQSMRYAIAKARRRGLKNLPEELAIYLTLDERIELGAALPGDTPPERHAAA